MVLWAVFTIGFFAGVLLTLSVFVGKRGAESVSEAEDIADEARSVNFSALGFLADHNEIHAHLVRQNYPPTQLNKGSILGEQVASALAK